MLVREAMLCGKGACACICILHTTHNISVRRTRTCLSLHPCRADLCTPAQNTNDNPINHGHTLQQPTPGVQWESLVVCQCLDINHLRNNVLCPLHHIWFSMPNYETQYQVLSPLLPNQIIEIKIIHFRAEATLQWHHPNSFRFKPSIWCLTKKHKDGVCGYTWENLPEVLTDTDSVQKGVQLSIFQLTDKSEWLQG